ncbi:hypothetical protein BMS3Abin12_01673 [bacterium BMS3Abin12]|nr:hypothetical protein BMS3Abin12_01673 [bacterium BMS3Abin12]
MALYRILLAVGPPPRAAAGERPLAPTIFDRHSRRWFAACSVARSPRETHHSTIHEAHSQGNPLTIAPIPVPAPCRVSRTHAFRPRFCPDPRALRWVRAAPGMPRGHSERRTSSPKSHALLVPILAFGEFLLPIRELKISAGWDFGDSLAPEVAPTSHGPPATLGEPAAIIPWAAWSAGRARPYGWSNAPGGRTPPGRLFSRRAGRAPPATLGGPAAIIP